MRFITLTLYESVKGHFKGHKGSDQNGYFSMAFPLFVRIKF